VILDESRAHKHPIMGVGGILVKLEDVPATEHRWNEVKAELGIEDISLKCSMSWPERSLRGEMIGLIADLPLRCVAVLLEDFRPLRLRLKKETRSDLYVYSRAFEWLLQRLASPLFKPTDDGPHMVVFDLRDDLRHLATEYARHHPRGWTFPSNQLPSLQSLGYSASLYATGHGPLVEIADLVISGLTRWAGARCQAHRLKNVPELSELERDCAALREHFPTKGSIGRCWRGYSIVTFRENRTGKELLYDNLDRWLRDLPAAADHRSENGISLDELAPENEDVPPDDDIPF
jgi:hypothetical protein